MTMSADADGRQQGGGGGKPAATSVISENLMQYAKSTRANELDKDLTICDIIGEWGLYQWSLVAFAAIYSGMFCTIVVIGPIWTPDMAHRCVDAAHRQLAADELRQLKRQYFGGGGGHGSALAASGNESSLPGPYSQCYVESDASNSTSSSSSSGDPEKAARQACEYFVYDDEPFGRMLTNSFDLVCDRHWLRSFIMSSALLGMLISSVTLGQLSDKYGRLRCIQISFAISLVSTLGAILSPNYLLLNVFICLMSYAQAGAGNALCTLVMEATTPRLRYVATFEYCFGWGLGMMATPLLNNLTHDYVYYLLALLAFQLLMLPWLHFGVFESIRWLLSEGRINEGLIEIRRACFFNRVRNNPHLAQKIARLQMQQVRKASILVANKLDKIIDMYQTPSADKPPSAARGAGAGADAKRHSTQSGSSAGSLNELGEAIRKSLDYLVDGGAGDGDADEPPEAAGAKAKDFIKVKDADSMSLKTVVEEPMDIETTTTGPDNGQQRHDDTAGERRISLSPTLANRLFSVSGDADPAVRADKRAQQVQPPVQMMINGKPLELDEDEEFDDESIAPPTLADRKAPLGERKLSNNQLATLELLKRNSMTSQGLVQLLMQYKNKLHEKEDGGFFVAQMFHRKLYKQTILLLMLELSLETSYYGFVQANKFIGSSVELNYLVGAISDMTAATLAMVISALMSRKSAVIVPTLVGVTACMTLAGLYQFAPIPVEPALMNDAAAAPSGPPAPVTDASSLGSELNPFGAAVIPNEEELIEHFEEAAAAADDDRGDRGGHGQDGAPMETIFQLNGYRDQLDSAVIQDTIVTTEVAVDDDQTTTDTELDLVVEQAAPGSSSSSSSGGGGGNKTAPIDIAAFRNTFDVVVMTLGKLATVTALQVAATISMEIYPSNLRQTGSGAIIFVGRIGSIVAPFLFNDPSEDKLMLKATLVTLASISALVCLATPFFLHDKKDEELCDRLGEIDDD